MNAAPSTSLWARLDALVDRAPRLEDLFHHRLGAIAARRRRSLGLELPGPLLEEERFAASIGLAAPIVLERVIAACGDRVMVLKGPEVACGYPDPGMRPHHDLDLLVEDSAAAHEALLAAGCEVRWDRPSEHHELPLLFPDLPLVIELHHVPKHPPWAPAPSVAELFSTAVTSRWDARVLAPAPAHHAVLVAGHAWAERPLRRVLDLVDVKVMLGAADAGDAAAVARSWGLARVWDATLDAAAAVLDGAPEPWTLRTWARNTPAVRERTRSEELLERLLAPFAALPARRAARWSAMAPRRGGHMRRGAYEHPALAGELTTRAASPERD